MVRSWLLRVVFLAVSFHSCLFPTITWSQGNQTLAVLGKIPTDRIIDQIALSPGSGLAYGISVMGKLLYVLDLESSQVRKKVGLPQRPTGLAVNPQNNQAYVISRGPIPGDSLYVLNPEGEILRRRSVPKNPQGIAVSPDKGIVVVTSADEYKLLLLSTESLETIKEIPLAYRPKRIALDLGSDRAVVSAKEHWGSIEANLLLIVDLNTGALLQEMKFEEGILGLATADDLDRAVAVSREAIHLIDIQSGTLVSTIRPSISLSGGMKAGVGGAEAEDYLGVDINPATQTAVVIGQGGFVLIDLTTLTARDYPLNNDPVMKAVALDRFRNTFLGSYWKSPAPLVLERGVLEVQLPSPAPEITSLTPSEADRGGDGRIVTLEGKGFIKASEGYFSNRPLATTLLDNCHLQLLIPKELLSQGGHFPLTVFNPGPQGDRSNSLDFAVKNPRPLITALNPAAALSGTQNLWVDLYGSGFIAETLLTVQGQAKAFTLLNGTRLQVSLAPSDLETTGDLALAAMNPGPGGGSSNTMSLSISNPLPILSAISPQAVKAGETEFRLALTGSNFTRASTVLFGQTPLPVIYLDGSRLEVVIPANAVKNAGTYPVTVGNPAPGGGQSGAQDLSVTPVSSVAPLPAGSFGKPYEDLFPPDAAIPSYDPKRFSLITGLVHGVNGNPLSGVTVSVLGHPEYGTAATDTGGRFSLPLDGGGTVTIAYQKTGFLTAHRTVEAGWNTIAPAENLVMIGEDTAATAITFDGNAATIFTHTSSTVSDPFGRRSLTLVFSGDNRALVPDAQGNEQVVPQITVRATEFTTPESMPAKLPPSSAFTYCAELSVDGAKNVRFEKPVVVWVDNFLGFNVGEVVPVGFYDRDRAVWVPSTNGRVVTLLDTDADGVVDAYDSLGDGQPHGPVAGLTDPGRYKPGDSFWRVELDHFSPWDCNWPYGPPGDAIGPNPPSPPINAIKGKGCELTHLSSYVENQECTFHEDLPIPGTDLLLHYASNRTPGFKPRVTIPASGSSVPTSLLGIIVKMELAGKVYEVTLPPQPNQQAEFVWDGRDYLGREVAGSFLARVRIGFEYPTVYYSGSSVFAQAFAQPGTDATWVEAREHIIAWKESALTLYRGKADLAEGWTLSSHHLLDPGDPDTLHQGNGASLRNNIRTISTAASAKRVGDGLSYIRGVVVDKAGNIYFSDWYNYRYMKLDPSGVITYYPTLNTNIGPVKPSGLALDGVGNLYFTHPEVYSGDFVGKIDPTGGITIIAGNRQKGFSGDNGPAVEARLNYPEDLAVDAYGNIYITDTWNNRIRKVDPNGVITTIAGTGQPGYSGDGGPATSAGLKGPRGVALDSRGNIYIADTDNNRIRKIGPNGTITTIAGNGLLGFTGDGGPATQARIAGPRGLALDPTGNLYIADAVNNRIRKVDTSGIITTIAGNGQRDNNNGDGGPATQATVHDPAGVAVDSSGNIYAAISAYGKIKKISWPGAFQSQGFSGNTVFTDENARGYILDSTGTHRTTYDLATGKTLVTFGYDQANKLVSITDRFSNQTTIQRDGSGVPLSITSPDGQMARLTVDGNNHLTAVAYPDNAVYAFAYSPDGLLTEKADPRGNRFGHRYDASGLITQVFDPEGGNWGFSRTVDNAGNAFTTLQTAEGNATTYQDRTDFGGNYTSIKTDPWGSLSSFSRSFDGLTETDQSSCGLNRTMQYDLDPAYKYKYLQKSTQSSPAGLTQTILDNRAYLDTNGDTVPDRMTKTLSLNGRNWVFTNNALTGTETGTSPLGRTITRTYDPENLLTRNVTVAGLLPLSYAYDEKGRMTGSTRGSRTSTIAYDNQGNIEKLITPDQKIYRFTYDPMGRPKTQLSPDNTLIRYNYDLNGNMDLLTNPNNIGYGFDYTGINLRRTMALPTSGSYWYRYDKDRNLKTIDFPSNKQISNEYTSGRLSKVTTPEGETNYSYQCGSLLAAANKGTEKISYGYDGSFLKTDSRTGLLNQTIDYTYDNDFRLASTTYGGSSQALTYDNDGLLTGVGAFTITRNAQNGLPVGISDGTFSAARIFNGYGDLEGTTYNLGGTNRYSYTLTRDTAGRITRKIEVFEGGPDTFEYTYDDVGRLSGVSKTNSVVEAYSYDANGNRLLETNQYRGINQRAYSYSLEDHLVSAGMDTYQFDVDGFLTGKTTAQGAMATVYSSRGELLSASLPDATVITYDHDPLGRRITKKVNGTVVEKYLWKDTTTLLAVYDGNDNLVMRFNYGDNRLPVSMTHNGSTYYLLGDSIGSLRAVTDTSGNIIKRIDYDSFGNIIFDSDPNFLVPFGFAGGLHDRNTGLVRFGVRDYDPTIGRWTAKDPIDFGGGDTNLYGYVGDDPVNWVDPEGLFPNWLVPPYGKYGGPGRSGPGRPIDSMDKCYKGHDDCYTDSGITEWDEVDSCKLEKRRRCDRAVDSCLSKLSIIPLAWETPPPWWMPPWYVIRYRIAAQILFWWMGR